MSPLVVASCVLAHLGHACGGTPSATFALDVPKAIAAEAAWYEIGLFPSGCPSSGVLLGGIPTEGTAGRLAFSATTKAPPGLGAVPNQTYGIAAVARAADCSVIATGCSSLGLNSSSTLSVGITPVSSPPAGACAAGATCQDAVCVPLPGGGTLGAGCSLELVGAGPLADRFTEPDTILSQPAITATTSGFLIAYREFDPSTGKAQLTTIALDPSGGAGAPSQVALMNGCAAAPQSDGVGLAFGSGSGTVAVARPPCNNGAGGIELRVLTASGAIEATGFAGSNTTNVTLGPVHSLSNTSSGLLLAFTDVTSASSFVAPVVGVGLPKKPAPARFGALSSPQSSIVVGADVGAGFLSLGSGVRADGGACTVDNGGIGTSWASLATENASDAGVSPIPVSFAFRAAWASASGVGSRIIVASNGPSLSRSILWSAFDVGGCAPFATGSFAPQTEGPVSFSDVALHQDHAFFAAEVGQDISLFLFEKASTIPIFLREVPFSSQPSIPLGALADGLVALAVSDTLVAVVWGTRKNLTANDAVGGYAMFACTP